MCTVCGCGEGEAKIEQHGHTHDHDHTHEHPHTHSHADAKLIDADHHHDIQMKNGDLDYGSGLAHANAPGQSQARMVRIEQDILGKNNGYAQNNRKYLAEHGIFAVNMVSSPGSGKTTLLVKTIEMLKDKLAIYVIEGDQQTSNDAERIRATGIAAIQINTGKGCHLDAQMVGRAIERLSPEDGALLMIENVGNLVCPAAFDLGEAHKVVILSVTEGEDKPLKYPDMFHASDLMIINKIDLLPHLNFNIKQCNAFALRINPKLKVLQLSATSGQGMNEWLDWLITSTDNARHLRWQNIKLLQNRIAELEAQLASQV